MKKLIVVSLCLIGILLITGTGFAVEDEYCQVYRSTVVTDDEMLGSWQDCIEVCVYPDGWAQAWTYCNYPDYLILTVEGLGSDFKDLVGFSDYYPKTCHASVGKRGNNLEADCMLEMDGGVRIHARGVPDNNCRCEEDHLE
jgi:hypothetical protein